MKYFLSALLLLTLRPLFAQTLQWAKAINHAQPIGSLINELTKRVTTDAAGNVYVTGTFQNSMDFDPGPGVFYLTSAGYTDIFIAKYSPNGDLIFAKQIGGTEPDFGADIAIDPSGNIVVTGMFQGTVDFDPGVGTQIRNGFGKVDVFFGKYDNSGNYVFVQTMGGFNDDYVSAVALDPSGNIYLSGIFFETMDFDPGTGSQVLTSVRYQDYFFAKYDASGNYVYAKDIGGIWSEEAPSNIAVDASGNLYFTGSYVTTVDFDPGPGVQNLTSPTVGLATYADIFLAKYDQDGNYVYAKKITGSPGLLYSYMTLDQTGNINLTGGFSQTADFDPGPGIYNLTSKGDFDIFIAKYDNNGTLIYAKNMGGSGFDYATSIAVDATGRIYITGEFSDVADFDPDPGKTENLTANNGDAFFASYDAAGNYIYAKRIGSFGSDYGECLTLDTNDNLIISGAFEETVYFDCTTTLTALGATDLYIAKYGPLQTAIIEQPVNVSSCAGGNTSFKIKATNYLSTQWQVNTGSGWMDITNNNTYSGAGTDSLFISNANPIMNNYQYRCLVKIRCDTIFSSASTLTVFPTPSGFLPPDTSICTYGSLTLYAPAGFTGYLWYDGSGNRTTTLTKAGTYWLRVTDQQNCTGKDSITISSKDCSKGFFIPTAFTPNRDRKNDLFRPLLFGNVKKYKFTIYNRWGQVMFQTNDMNKGWDGIYAGKDQGPNVFIWLCDYEFEGEKEKLEKGFVVLIR